MSQSTDQRIFTGGTPEWSDSEAPAQKVTGVYLCLPVAGSRPAFFHRYFFAHFQLDNKLNYETNALECARRVSHKLYTLTKIMPLINNTQALCLYKSKILPYFDYGDILYNKTFRRTLLKLQKLENQALKLCLRRDHLYNTDLLHLETNVPKLDNRRTCHITFA